MAFNARNLHCIGYAHGFTLWHYHSTDTIEKILSTGYFNFYGNLRLRTGDIIMLHANTAGSTREFAQLVIVNDDPKADITTQLLASAAPDADKSLPRPANDIQRPTTLTLAAARFSRAG